MEARATAKYVRVSARKTNQVLDLVRGRDVESAMQLLTFTPKHVARTVLKVLKSAVANAVQAESRLNPEDLVVKECLVGPAPIMKRFLPRAQGRATPILKRSCHITIIVGAREGALERFEAHPAPKAKAEPAAGEAAAPKKAAAPKPAAAAGAVRKKGAGAKAKTKTKTKTKTKATAKKKAAVAGAATKAAPKKKKEKSRSPLRENKRG